MADIGALGNLNSAEPLDLSLYPDVKASGFELPKAGRYVVKAPDAFPATSFGATKANFLSAQVDPTIMGPTNEGFTLRFTKVSAKPFMRGGKTASQLGDYLRAAGMTASIPGDPQGQANAVEATAGRTYEVIVDWSVYNPRTQFKLEGMVNFPSDGKGGHQSWVEDPSEKDGEGNPLRLRANLFVRKYIPAA